ncbi:glycosyltransferase [Iodobacter ciconiae]|uniref:Glycosyltransferase n=1 Tax=Iodobacter ciconiae TaxID=2496266 RepID=A0A3S8ZQ92_9NEIS|nr:glycosyltransferase [Iodobacter ciconiae]AZN35634.1 glycosyltransferase [Iodobacter ciconiae]
MRIALIAPLPPEQSGIADYADAFQQALSQEGLEMILPFKNKRLGETAEQINTQMQGVHWQDVDLVHAELGGGRNGEFLALEWLARHYPLLPLSATVHDPERIIWRPLGWPDALGKYLPRRAHQALVLLCDPWTLARERRLAAKLTTLITLTALGASRLALRMRLPEGKVQQIAHGNQIITPQALPPLPPHGPLKLLYFGFIYRGKGIEDLIAALALLMAQRPAALVELTLAGGTAPEMTFANGPSYLDELKTQLQAAGLPVHMVRWQLDVPTAEIVPLIQSHHVLVLPYQESKKLAFLGQMRGTSGVLSWAAACGRSVISSDARSFAEEVSFNNGAVYPQGNTAALAALLLQLLDQPALLPQRSTSAEALGVARRWPNIAKQFGKLFSGLIQGKPNAPHL